MKEKCELCCVGSNSHPIFFAPLNLIYPGEVHFVMCQSRIYELCVNKHASETLDAIYVDGGV